MHCTDLTSIHLLFERVQQKTVHISEQYIKILVLGDHTYATDVVARD